MKKAYFLSDLHLGASYNEDNRATERHVVSFLEEIRHDACEIYLLGDILDYWFEYRDVVPRGFVRFFGKLADIADSGIKITWLIGNHDIWIFDYIPSELGIEVIDGILEREILGVSFCLQHGDAIGGSAKFRFMRAMFRNRVCQKLYSGIHPRWTVGFAFACSRKSRMKEKRYPYTGTDRLLEGLRIWCGQQIKEGNKACYYLFGHLHKAFEEKLPEGRELIVLPAWPDRGGYGIFDGKEFHIRYGQK